MKKANTSPGRVATEKAIISEIVQSNVEAANTAPKTFSRGNTSAWLKVNAYIKGAKANEAEAGRLKKLQGRSIG